MKIKFLSTLMIQGKFRILFFTQNFLLLTKNSNASTVKFEFKEAGFPDIDNGKIPSN